MKKNCNIYSHNFLLYYKKNINKLKKTCHIDFLILLSNKLAFIDIYLQIDNV